MFDLIKFLNIIKNNSSTELDIANERTIDFSAAQQSSYSFPDERQQGVHLQLVQLSETHLLTAHSKFARVWNLDSNETVIIKSPSSRHGIVDVRRLANNRILFNQLDSADIYIYDWKEQKLICKTPPDGAYTVLENSNLVMVRGDKTGKVAIKIWDSEQGTLLNTFYEKLAKPKYPISIYPVFSLGNDRIAFIIREINTLFVWDIKDGHQINSINNIYTAPAPVGLVCPIVKLSSGKHVVTSCRQDVLDVWEVESGSHIQTFKTLGGLSTYLVCNNGQLVAAYKTGDMQVWDLQTGKDIQLLKNAGGALFQISDNLVVTVPRDGNVKVWDTQNWQCLKVLGGYYTTPSISCEGISDNKLAVLYYDQLKIWEFGYRHLQLQDIIELLKALKNNQSITTLNLVGVTLNDQGAIEVANLLTQNLTITTIDLRNTSITDEGAKALWDALQRNRTIRVLRLEGNFISADLLEQIYKHLTQRNVPLSVSEANSNKQKAPPSGATVKSSSAQEKIRAINIGNSPGVAHVDQTEARNINAVSFKQTTNIPRNDNANLDTLTSSPSPTASVSHTKVRGDLNVSSTVNNMQPVATVTNAQVTGDVHVSSHLHIGSPPLSPQEKRIVSQQRLEDGLQQLHVYRLKDETVQAELATYVPVQGTTSFEDNEFFDVATEVKTFLKSNKKVLLLLGDSGMGKSLFSRALERELWENYDISKPIPLFISLSSLQDPIKHTIDEHLLQLGFKAQQIPQLQQKFSFIFILDGYDEIANRNPDNLYVSNKLSGWNAKVVISCRSQYLLAKRQVYRNRFLPDYKDQPEPGLFQEIMLKPFTQKQIEIYLKKFVEIEKPLWGDWQIYRKHIDVIPGLKSLIETPFLLRITVEVLPDIIGRCETQEEYAALTRLDLYDAFAQRWFERQEYKLRKQGHPIDLEWDIKSDFHNFSQKLAERMLEQKVSEIVIETKVKQRFGQSQAQSSASQWDEFFGNDPTLQLIRSGCPLKKLGENRYAFIHETLLIYFGDRDKFAQSMTPQVKPSVKQVQSPAIHPVVQQSEIFKTPPVEEINLTFEQLSLKNIIKTLKQYPNLKSIGIPKQEFLIQSETSLSRTGALHGYPLKGRLISKDRFVLFQESPYEDGYNNGEKGYNIDLAIYRIKDGALINSFSYKHISSEVNSYSSYTEHGTLASLEVLNLDHDLLSICYTHSYRLRGEDRASVVFCLFDISTGELLDKKTLPVDSKITSFLEKNNRLYINRKFYIDNFIDFIKSKQISEGFHELSEYYLKKCKLGGCLSSILVDFLDNDRLLILQNQLLSVFDTRHKKNISSIKIPYQEKMEFKYVNSQLFLYSKSDGKNFWGYLIDIEINGDGQLRKIGEKKLTDQLLSYFLNDENTLVASKSNYYILFGSESHHNNYVFLFDARTQNIIFSFTLHDRCPLALSISDKQLAIVTDNTKGELKFTTYNSTNKVIKYLLDFRSLLKEGCDVQINNQTNQLTFQLKDASVLSIEEKEKYLKDLKSCGDFISVALGHEKSDLLNIGDSNSKKGSLIFYVKEPNLFPDILEILNALACQQPLTNEASITFSFSKQL